MWGLSIMGNQEPAQHSVRRCLPVALLKHLKLKLSAGLEQEVEERSAKRHQK